jgi:hypothetical protein
VSLLCGICRSSTDNPEEAQAGKTFDGPMNPKPTPPGWKPRIDLGATMYETYEALKKLVTPRPL